MRIRSARLRFIALTLSSLLVGGLLQGCAALQRTLGLTAARQDVEGDLVKRVAFEGNGGPFSGQADYALRQEIETEQSPRFVLAPVLTYFLTPERFDPDALLPDGYRLEIWYAHHGWFDAAFQGWEVRQVRPRTSKLAGAVSITGYIDPGPRSLVRDFDIVGLKGASEVAGRVVMRTGPVDEGDPFDIDAVFAARDALRDRLRSQSFAYAQVEVEMEAWPAEQAVEVRLLADPGISSEYGEIEIGGFEAIDEAVIRDELEIEPGEPFDQEELTAARARLLELGTFSVVSITPDLSDPSAPAVPLRVEVTESRFRTIRLGGGVDYDSVVLTPRVAASFRHVNLFDQLLRLQTRVEAGYSASLGTSIQSATPVGELGAGLSHPRLFGSRRFGGLVSAEAEQGLQNGQFPFMNTRVDASVTWRPNDVFVMTFGPHWELYRYLRLAGTGGLVAEAVFGEGFQNPYRLTTFDADAALNQTDDPVTPTRGYILTGGVRQAVPFREQDFFYTELTAAGRLYRPVRGVSGPLRYVIPEGLAFGGRGQVLQPWGGRPLPFPERAFLGGSTDLRGFRDDGVGPYTCLCVYDDLAEGDPFTNEPAKGGSVNQQYLPVGGSIAALVSAEARYDITGAQSFVAFFDAGLLARDWQDIGPSAVRMGYGVGYRYRSGIGPFRVDLGFRPLYPEDWGPVEYVNCRPEDRDPRAFDLLSLPQNNRQLFDRDVPFAVNLYLGLGEAL